MLESNKLINIIMLETTSKMNRRLGKNQTIWTIIGGEHHFLSKPKLTFTFPSIFLKLIVNLLPNENVNMNPLL